MLQQSFLPTSPVRTQRPTPNRYRVELPRELGNQMASRAVIDLRDHESTLAFIDPRLAIVMFVLLGIVYLLPTPRVLAMAQQARAMRRSHARRRSRAE